MASTQYVLPVVVLAFCTWAVSLGGISSLQTSCKDTSLVSTRGVPESAIEVEFKKISESLGEGVNFPDISAVKTGGSWFLGSAALNGVRGFSSSVLTCEKVYRYYWFIVAFQFIITVAALYVVAAGTLKYARASLMGLFVIAALLYMQSADSFLTAESLDWYQTGQHEHRARTMTAGCIMTAVANCFVIFALGLNCDDCASPAA